MCKIIKYIFIVISAIFEQKQSINAINIKEIMPNSLRWNWTPQEMMNTFYQITNITKDTYDKVAKVQGN